MVEYTWQLDSVFGSLADATRRDILGRVAQKELSMQEIAEAYPLSLAAISKHVKILEKAKLISKRRRGKQQLVVLTPNTLKDANDYLQHYQTIWHNRFEALEQILKEQA